MLKYNWKGTIVYLICVFLVGLLLRFSLFEFTIAGIFSFFYGFIEPLFIKKNKEKNK